MKTDHDPQSMTRQQQQEAAHVLAIMRAAGQLPVSPDLYPLTHAEAKAAAQTLYVQLSRALVDLDTTDARQAAYSAALNHGLMVYVALLDLEADRVDVLAALGTWAANWGAQALISAGDTPLEAAQRWEQLQSQPMTLAALLLGLGETPEGQQQAARLLAAVGLHWGAETALTYPEALSTLSQRLGHMPGGGTPTLKA